MTRNGLGQSPPNQYHLQGGGIAVSWFPHGAGPAVDGCGALCVTYRDATRSLRLGTAEVRTADVPDLGTIVSVTLVRTVDAGSTTFGLLVPSVVLSPPDGRGVPVETEGITSMHRSFDRATGRPRHVTYTVTPLRGTAGIGILPG